MDFETAVGICFRRSKVKSAFACMAERIQCSLVFLVVGLQAISMEESALKDFAVGLGALDIVAKRERRVDIC